MKRFSFKTGAAVLLILLSGFVCSCQKRYPHEHVKPGAFEPLAKILAVDYTMQEGETLASVARLRYAHQKYASVIKLYNHIEDETRVKANSTLRLPDMSVILDQEGVTKVIPEEVNLILCARAKYDRVRDQLWNIQRPSDAKAIPEDVKREMLEAADDLQQAIAGMKKAKPGVNAAPLRTIGQLEQSMEGMRTLTERLDNYGYDIDLVQQHFALALTYSIIWARNGFK